MNCILSPFTAILHPHQPIPPHTLPPVPAPLLTQAIRKPILTVVYFLRVSRLRKPGILKPYLEIEKSSRVSFFLKTFYLHSGFIHAFGRGLVLLCTVQFLFSLPRNVIKQPQLRYFHFSHLHSTLRSHREKIQVSISLLQDCHTPWSLYR